MLAPGRAKAWSRSQQALGRTSVVSRVFSERVSGKQSPYGPTSSWWVWQWSQPGTVSPHCLFVGQFGMFHQHLMRVHLLPQQFQFSDSQVDLLKFVHTDLVRKPNPSLSLMPFLQLPAFSFYPFLSNSRDATYCCFISCFLGPRQCC